MDKEKETRKRALASEGVLMLLIESLAMRGIVSLDEAEDMLVVLAHSSDASAARATSLRNIIAKLKQLRGGAGGMTPGARHLESPPWRRKRVIAAAAGATCLRNIIAKLYQLRGGAGDITPGALNLQSPP